MEATRAVLQAGIARRQIDSLPEALRVGRSTLRHQPIERLSWENDGWPGFGMPKSPCSLRRAAGPRLGTESSDSGFWTNRE